MTKKNNVGVNGKMVSRSRVPYGARGVRGDTGDAFALIDVEYEFELSWFEWPISTYHCIENKRYIM